MKKKTPSKKETTGLSSKVKKIRAKSEDKEVKVKISHANKEEPQGVGYWESRVREDLKRDWGEKKGDWITGYWESKDHPHRELILEALKQLGGIQNLLELGCNCGPNLARIQEEYPYAELKGMDVNQEAVNEAQKRLPRVEISIGDFTKQLPYDTGRFDVVLADAVLLYVDRDSIESVFREIDRVTKKGVVLVEWYAKNVLGEIVDYHWARDYVTLLKRLGYTVNRIPLSKANWPTDKWTRNGSLFIAVRA